MAQNIVDAALALIEWLLKRPFSKQHGRSTLGIEIDEQNTMAIASPQSGQLGRERGLAHPTLVVAKRNDRYSSHEFCCIAVCRRVQIFA